MKARDSITGRLHTRHFAAIIGCVAALTLAGCGKEDNAGSTSTSSKSAKITATTQADDQPTSAAPAPTAVSAGQLDFFTERYISADERLQRRQQRIEQELAGGSPAGPS